MQKLLSLAKSGLSGINTDMAPWDLPPEFITNGRNFRILNGSIRVNGGWSELNNANVPTYNLTKFIPVGTNRTDLFFVAGEHGLYSWDGEHGSTLLNIETALLEPREWTFCRMGGIPIANHPEIGAFYWYPVAHRGVGVTEPVAKYLPFDKILNWETATLKKSCKVMRAHKTFLFALNLREEVNGQPTEMQDAFRWSHPAPINSIPVTWETDTIDAQFFLSGIGNLGSHSGRIVDGLSMRDSFVIYSDEAINVLTQSGDEFVWRRSELTTTAGLLARDCVVEIKGAHFLLATDDIVVNNGNTIESIVHNVIRTHLQANMSTEHFRHSFVAKNNVDKELWFCVPTNGNPSPDPNLAYIYNWKDGSWAIKDLPLNTRFASYGSRSIETMTWEKLSHFQPMATWDRYDSPWGSSYSTPFDDTIIGLTADSGFYDLDPIIPDTMIDIMRSPPKELNMFIERTNYSIEGQRNVTTIVSVYPHIKGVGHVRITLGSHDHAGSDIRWKEPFIFDTSKDRKVEVRTTGELHAWRIESTTLNTFEFSGMDIEYVPAGLR